MVSSRAAAIGSLEPLTRLANDVELSNVDCEPCAGWLVVGRLGWLNELDEPAVDCEKLRKSPPLEGEEFEGNVLDGFDEVACGGVVDKLARGDWLLEPKFAEGGGESA